MRRRSPDISLKTSLQTEHGRNLRAPTRVQANKIVPTRSENAQDCQERGHRARSCSVGGGELKKRTLLRSANPQSVVPVQCDPTTHACNKHTPPWYPQNSKSPALRRKWTSAQTREARRTRCDLMPACPHGLLRYGAENGADRQVESAGPVGFPMSGLSHAAILKVLGANPIGIVRDCERARGCDILWPIDLAETS